MNKQQILQEMNKINKDYERVTKETVNNRTPEIVSLALQLLKQKQILEQDLNKIR